MAKKDLKISDFPNSFSNQPRSGKLTMIQIAFMEGEPVITYGYEYCYMNGQEEIQETASGAHTVTLAPEAANPLFEGNTLDNLIAQGKTMAVDMEAFNNAEKQRRIDNLEAQKRQIKPFKIDSSNNSE